MSNFCSRDHSLRLEHHIAFWHFLKNFGSFWLFLAPNLETLEKNFFDILWLFLLLTFIKIKDIDVFSSYLAFFVNIWHLWKPIVAKLARTASWFFDMFFNLSKCKFWHARNQNRIFRSWCWFLWFEMSINISGNTARQKYSVRFKFHV